MRNTALLCLLLLLLCGCGTVTSQEQVWAKDCPEYQEYLKWRWLTQNGAGVTDMMKHALSPCAVFKSIRWQYLHPGEQPPEDES